MVKFSVNKLSFIHQTLKLFIEPRPAFHQFLSTAQPMKDSLSFSKLLSKKILHSCNFSNWENEAASQRFFLGTLLNSQLFEAIQLF